jgi:hypothetical protein
MKVRVKRVISQMMMTMMIMARALLLVFGQEARNL